MAELLFHINADDVLRSMEADRSAAEALRRIWDGLDALAADPGAPEVRARSFHRGPWGFTVRDRTTDWLILWEAGPAAGEVTVLYVGPDL
jgi:hypothetical protein